MFKVGEMTHKSQVETLQPPGFPDLDAQRVHFAPDLEMKEVTTVTT